MSEVVLKRNKIPAVVNWVSVSSLLLARCFVLFHLLLYIHSKQPRSCRAGHLLNHTSMTSLSMADY